MLFIFLTHHWVWACGLFMVVLKRCTPNLHSAPFLNTSVFLNVGLGKEKSRDPKKTLNMILFMNSSTFYLFILFYSISNHQ
jgi:hypothetical protein